MRRFMCISATSLIGLVSGTSHSLEPELDTMITSIPTAVVANADGSFDISTSPIPATPIGDYYSLNETEIPVYSRSADGKLFPGIVLTNSTDDLIPKYHLYKPSMVYFDDGDWKVRNLFASGSVNLAPGNSFTLLDSTSCSIGVVDEDLFTGVLPISFVVGTQEEPTVIIDYDPAGAPAWADQTMMEDAIDRAVEAWTELLVNEADTPNHNFRFLWDTTDQLDATTVAQAQTLTDFNSIWNVVRQNFQASSDSGSSPAEDSLYLQFPSGPSVRYAWSQDADDDAFVIGFTIAQLINSGTPRIESQDIILNTDPEFSNGDPAAIDLDPEDGIDADKLDLVGVLIHEIGHNIGFISTQYLIEDQVLTDQITMWDVFRLGISAADGGNVTAGEFSGEIRELRPDVDAWGVAALGQNRLWPLDTAAEEGNVGHWADFPPTSPMYIGLMYPTVDVGSRLVDGSYFQLADIKAVDVMGYDIDDNGIDDGPEPGDNVDPEPDEQVDPTLPTGLVWNTGNNGTLQHVFVYRLGVNGERIEVFSQRDLAPSTTTVSIPADTLVPGAQHEWFVTTDNWRGFAYSTATQFFAEGGTPCVADVNGDGMLTPADFTAWIAAFNAGSPECDQNGDGNCTPTDFTAWIANFNAGCP